MTFKQFRKLFREEKRHWASTMTTWKKLRPLMLFRASLKAADACAMPDAVRAPLMVTKISPADRMYKKCSAQSYFEAAYTALACVNQALAEAGKGPETVRHILDLPCGHGRVLRALRAAFREADIVACDLELDGVDYCAKHFNAIPLYSEKTPESIEPGRSFDLIWVGSLLTHIDAPRWRDFLAFFSRVLAPGGVLVFTTHGPKAVHRMRTLENCLGMTPEKIEKLLAGYQQGGFGYEDYRDGGGYGTSVSTPEWVKSQVESTPGLCTVSYREEAWFPQDVTTCVKMGESPVSA